MGSWNQIYELQGHIPCLPALVVRPWARNLTLMTFIFHWSSKRANNTGTYVVPLMLKLTVNSEEKFWKTTHAGSCYHLLKQSKRHLDVPWEALSSLSYDNQPYRHCLKYILSCMATDFHFYFWPVFGCSCCSTTQEEQVSKTTAWPGSKNKDLRNCPSGEWPHDMKIFHQTQPL